ncbi:MAG: DUF2726 domain-containing protein [Aquincola sp.]|nr:DUF2726 domain-containing protein [Aquincola sp.]MDH4290212.1 DUF2726 domain-containing protein [Aquincola sp.]MDH5331856.1 DUF2726 domain-containing protein [Aquincola sp.]
MDLLLDPTLLAALICSLALLLALSMWRRRVPLQAPKRDDSLDTVQAWPPQAVRVMTLGERQAFEVLKRALPGHVILAQVPLSRFISVPTRNPYQQWLQRAGRLAVDVLVCDFSSRAIAAIEVRTAEESKRSAKRHQRLVEVLRAAGITVYEWNEDDLPSIAEVRDLFAARPAGAKEQEAHIDARGKRLIPVPEIAEVLAEGDTTDYGQLEPVPSAFYDDEDDLPHQRRMARAA